jgi:hypothetical protein
VAGEAGRVIALLLAAAPLAAAEARDANPIPALAGAYHEPGSWVQIIPIDARHAYVHFYFLGGVGGDLISEFEQVMTVQGTSLKFDEPATADAPGCSLTVRREGKTLAWHAPQQADCSAYANWHHPGMFMNGTMEVSSRRSANRTRHYPGEGYGYASTVADWCKAGRR